MKQKSGTYALKVVLLSHLRGGFLFVPISIFSPSSLLLEILSKWSKSVQNGNTVIILDV